MHRGLLADRQSLFLLLLARKAKATARAIPLSPPVIRATLFSNFFAPAGILGSTLLRLTCVFGFFFRHLTLLHRLAKKLSFKITSRLRSKACHAREVPLTPPPFNLRKSKKLPVQLRFEVLQPACAVPQHAAPDCWIGHSTGAPVDSANIVIPAPQQAVQADSKELIN